LIGGTGADAVTLAGGVTNASIDLGAGNDTDTSFPLRAGMEFHPNPDIRLLSEVQLAVSDEIRDDFAFTLGVLFPF